MTAKQQDTNQMKQQVVMHIEEKETKYNNIATY